jgi:hypothetical protein
MSNSGSTEGHYGSPSQALKPNITMNASNFDVITNFAAQTGTDLLFTVNLFPHDDASGAWNPTNFMTLLEYAVAHNSSVAGWELGEMGC